MPATSCSSILPSSLLSKNIKVKKYRPIILPVVCGCEPWSHTVREENRLKVFERRFLRGRRDEVTGEWRRLCDK